MLVNIDIQHLINQITISGEFESSFLLLSDIFDRFYVFCNKEGYCICDITVSLCFFVLMLGAEESGHVDLLLRRYHIGCFMRTTNTCLSLWL